MVRMPGNAVLLLADGWSSMPVVDPARVSASLGTIQPTPSATAPAVAGPAAIISRAVSTRWLEHPSVKIDRGACFTPPPVLQKMSARSTSAERGYLGSHVVLEDI